MTQKEKIKQLEDRVAKLEENSKTVQDRQYEVIKFFPNAPCRCHMCGMVLSFPHYCTMLR